MIAGYYACPVKVVRAIGALLRHDGKPHGRMNIVDPCAADGEAVVELAAAIERTTIRKSDSNIFACELEAGRAAALARRLRRDRRPELGVAVHSDAFRLRWEASDKESKRALKAGVEYLNPPYDDDREFGRLEERWLRHFLPMLDIDGGVLVFVIPITAIKASADTLAKNFTGVTTLRFPDPYYEQFKQVVILAKRCRPTFRPDPRIAAELRAFAETPETIPVLPMGDTAPLFMVPTAKDYDGIASHVRFERRPLDADAVAAAIRPWRFGEGGNKLVPGVLPENGVRGYMTESFTVALPLRPGYVAPALAVGVFDGVRVVPDDKASGLPPVFCKATFVRDWTDVRGGEKRNKDDEIVSKLQVQQPRLIMTALDLRRGRYTKIKPSLARESSDDLDRMTALDFIEAYNKSLLATLHTKCSPLYDPATEPPMEFRIARPLWKAQAVVGTASIRCLEKHGASLIEGETGVGKTGIATAIASTMTVPRTFGRTRVGARRVLIVCPPHLLAEWLDEIEVLRPDARATVIHDAREAEAFCLDDGGQTVFGILAETTGKLAHGWAGVGDTDAQPVHVEPPANDVEPLFRRDRSREKAVVQVGPATHAHRHTFLSPKRHLRACPSCGVGVTAKVRDLATKRLRCEHKARVPTNPQALLLERLALVLAPVLPFDEAVTERLRGRLLAMMVERWQQGTDQAESMDARWERARRGGLQAVVRAAVELVIRGAVTGTVREQIPRLVAAAADDGLAAWTARRLFDASLSDLEAYGPGSNLRDTACLLLPMIRDAAAADALVEELRAQDKEKPDRWKSDRWGKVQERLTLAKGGQVYGHHGDIRHDGKMPLFYQHPLGEPKLAREAFEAMRGGAETEEAPAACGDPLFAAVPEPRRVALAEYMAKRWKHRIDLVIVDEVHEASAQDSAQTQAMEQFRGRPMLGLTGTISNGYAASLFAILHTFSPLFRMEFRRDEIALFRERYGYAKRILQDVDRETKKPVIFGTVSNRVVRTTKSAGDAPGALPSFILRHFLPMAAPLHLSDLECEIPPMEFERVEMIDPGPVLGSRVRLFEATLADRIKADAFTPLSGKLFGQMSEAWSVADRATFGIGNSKDGIYRACYPESVGGAEVCRLEMLPPDMLLPKEQWLVETVRREIAEGRNVLICAWHADCGLYDRLAKLLREHVGIEAPILYSDKVQARERKDWLKANVVKKGARAMIVTSASIETGFNALVHFNTLVWYQSPGCAPRVARQTRGRIRRPGQKKPQRIYWPVYKGTLQVALHQLLQLKIAESQAVDGDDNTAALRAAGIEPVGGVAAFDLGRALYDAAKR